MKARDIFEKLSAPAQRALDAAGITKLSDFKKFTRKEITGLHGIGPSALVLLESMLQDAGIGFKAEQTVKKAQTKQGGTIIDEYIAGFPKPVQVKLLAIRAAIKEAAPDAIEKISYGMPTFYLNGNLVHFAAFKNHIGFYPTPSGISGFEKELQQFKSAKGSAQFLLDQELPLGLVRKIVKFRVEENMSKK